ncbi:coproporphyrinogen dehydrogenase HemZ [Lachnoclostridium phocaeense]|uniref:coproporphyrinogen dehydrogenase HemZ n=1 Tax=Lachnoclostridium phocaeense TaxID=1871021 RepID=UPI00248E1FB9|nr:coproporphyrinogen dehydrogenase HemZ [Lachnoclostridium phocaeense]
MIFLSCSNDMYTYNTYHLAKAFFPEEDVQQNVSEEMEDVFRITFPDGSVFAVKKEDIPAEENRSRKKYAVDVALYKACREYTGKELAWGILTGVRPTKIAMQKQEQGMDEESFVKWFGEDSLVSPGKAVLAWQIAGREKKILGQLDYRDGYSLYVGIPFCPSVCSYCSFSSGPIDLWKDHVEDYLGALMKELEWIGQRAGQQGKKLNTVYIGGGTPTTLSEEQLERLLSCIDRCFSRKHLLEYTVEAGRPDSITEGKLKVLRAHGITRISINPQTMQQKTLDLIGRRHTAREIEESFYMARSLGFDNINMDLIAGLPKETAADMADTLEKISAMGPDSLTVHSLAIKRAAKMGQEKSTTGSIASLAGDPAVMARELSAMIEEAYGAARGMGLFPYYLYRQKNIAGNFENVGFAKVDKAGIYNILIMEEKQTIIAAGAGSSTKILLDEPIVVPGSRHGRKTTLVRVENVKNIRDYITRIDEMINRKGEWLWR